MSKGPDVLFEEIKMLGGELSLLMPVLMSVLLFIYFKIFKYFIYIILMTEIQREDTG